MEKHSTRQTGKHAKSRFAHPRAAAGIIAAASAAVILAAALLVVNSGMFFFKPAVPDTDTVASGENSDGEGDVSAVGVIQEVNPVFSRPDQMKGAWLAAGTDYDTSSDDSGETVREQIDAAFTSLTDWKWNTVIVPLWANDKPLYASSLEGFQSDHSVIKNADGSDFDPLAYIQKCAKDRGMYVYGVLDTRIGLQNGWDPSTAEGTKAIHDMVSEAVSLYDLDGYLLDNVGYAAGSGGSYAAYMRQAAGAGFDNFLRNSITGCINDAINTIKRADSNHYVGLMADSVWANAADHERGSQTNSDYEALTDGYADTLGWVENGCFDFVMVKDYRSTTDSSAPFETVLNWWSDVCACKSIPLYVSHAANKAGGSETGWNSPDQLAKQVLACKKASGWNGSAFYSLSALQNDESGSTKAMLGAFSGDLNVEYISNALTFASPSQTTITTYEPTINIRGSADPNFPLTMNGQSVALSDHGFFSLDLDLSLGKNTFTFEHKGKTVTYTVTYKVVVLKSVEPASKLELDGGTMITVSAVARKGANVYSMINGTKVSMQEAKIQEEDSDTSNDSSNYIHYAGSYTLPDGIQDKEQNLGKVTVYGNYAGMNESKTGGSVYVKAKASVDGTNPNPNAEGDTGSDPIDPGSGGTVLKTGTIVWVSTGYAETFSGNTTDDWSRPTNAYMPRGTTDVIVKSVYDSASKNYYYLLGCGRRVYQSCVSVYQDDGTLTTNSIKLDSAVVNSGSTTIALDSSWLVPYNFRLLPQGYRNESKQEYDISAFTATYVDITFSYTTEASGTPDVSSSPLFSSAEWVSGDDNTSILRLHLRKAGGFYGYSVKWNKGRLTFTFQHPQPAASGSQPLSGKRIVIDPGHGGNSIGTAGGTIAEKTMTLKYGLMLRDKLEALGATVVMTRTTDVNPDNPNLPKPMDVRTALARNNGTDLFISIHMNGSTSSSARGYTVYYFNEYSKQYAADVNSCLENAGLGTNSNGADWSYFQVMRLHDCPSILVECGYMTNTQDLEQIISSDYQDKFTTALTDGIVDYFKGIG